MSIDLFCDFLTCAIHCILFNRSIYPKGLFERRRMYHVPVMKCRSSIVCDYIDDIINSIKPMLNENKIERFIIEVLDENESPIERIIFEIKRISKTSDETQLEASLRTFLIKLMSIDQHSRIRNSNQQLSWKIKIYTNDLDDDTILINNLWIDVVNEKKSSDDFVIIPLRSQQDDILNFQLFVEESKSKDKLEFL